MFHLALMIYQFNQTYQLGIEYKERSIIKCRRRRNYKIRLFSSVPPFTEHFEMQLNVFLVIYRSHTEYCYHI